jgi:hypothetical protein
LAACVAIPWLLGCGPHSRRKTPSRLVIEAFTAQIRPSAGAIPRSLPGSSTPA